MSSRVTARLISLGMFSAVLILVTAGCKKQADQGADNPAAQPAEQTSPRPPTRRRTDYDQHDLPAFRSFSLLMRWR
jgi:hypothetical protein